MPTSPSSRARRAARGARTRAHRRIVRGEREITQAWERIEARVRSALLSMSLDAVSRDSVARALEEVFRENADARAAIIESTTAGAAREGLSAGPAVAVAAFEQLGLAFNAPIDPRRAIEIATSHLHGPGAAAGITLSNRLHAHDQATTAAMARELAASFRAGRDVRDIAQRLLELDDAQVEVPRYVRDLEEAVADGDLAALRTTVLAHARSIERLSTPELRAAGRELLRSAARARQEDLERQVRYWIRDRALYQERVIVRTEGARAFGAAFIESTREQPWTKGYRWNLSPSHPKPDVCDLFANQALDGLGPGGYRAESLPAHPAHPNCFCFLTTILDDAHFERELAALTGSPEPDRGWEDPEVQTATEWLRAQPEATQLTILGPGRHRIWLTEPARVIGPRGRIAPLWQAAGTSGPAPRARGPRRSARAADPFGEAGSRRPTSAPTSPPTPTPAPAASTPRRPRKSPVVPPVPTPPPVPSPPPAPAPPPAPPPVPPPVPAAPPAAPPVSPVRRLLDAWEQRRDHDVRNGARAIIAAAYPGLKSHDVGQPNATSIANLPAGSTRGSHAFVGGLVRFNPAVRASLTRAADALRRGRQMLDDEMHAVRTLFHEEMHGHTGITPIAYLQGRGVGEVLEETLVELHAREITETSLSLPRGTLEANGSYPDYIAAVRSEVEAVFGPSGLDDRIRRAGRVVWSQGPIPTEREYGERFVDALAPPASRRAALLNGILVLRRR